MGNSQSIQKIGFEDIQYVINNKLQSSYIIISTLQHSDEICLLPCTINSSQEEEIVNKLMYQNKKINIIIYGKNSCDDTVVKRYYQLLNIGFYNVFVYQGGLFEWLTLQDIYGSSEFQTTTKQVDILKYKPHKTFGVEMLKY